MWVNWQEDHRTGQGSLVWNRTNENSESKTTRNEANNFGIRIWENCALRKIKWLVNWRLWNKKSIIHLKRHRLFFFFFLTVHDRSLTKAKQPAALALNVYIFWTLISRCFFFLLMLWKKIRVQDSYSWDMRHEKWKLNFILQTKMPWKKEENKMGENL